MLPSKAELINKTEKESKKRINKVSQKDSPKVAGKQSGSVAGPIGAVDLVAEESGEGFVKLVNKEKEAEQAEQEEQEKREKVRVFRSCHFHLSVIEHAMHHQAEKQDTKEIDQAATSPPGFKTETKGRVNMNDQSQPEHSGSRGDDGEAGKEGR